MKRKQLVRYLGNLLMVVAVVFMGYKLYQYREAFIGALSWRTGSVMLVSAMIIAGMFIVMGYMYSGLVGRISGGNAPKGLTVSIYCKSNLYKYIPGNVLQYVGRNQIAEFSDARHDQVALASLIEMGTQAVGSLLVAFLLARKYVMDWFYGRNIALLLAVAAGIVAVIIAAVVILKKRDSALLKELGRFINRRNAGFMLGLLAFIMMSQMLNGTLFVWLLRQLAIDLPANYWANIAGVYCFAWLVGFITPGAPGGMGIREALLSVLLANVVPPETITAAVILNRVVTICGDVIAFLASKLIYRYGASANRT